MAFHVSLRSIFIIFFSVSVSPSCGSEEQITSRKLHTIIYPLDSKYMLVSLPRQSTIPLLIDDVNTTATSFVILHAHSQNYSIVLSLERNNDNAKHVNSTDVGIVVPVNNSLSTNNVSQVELYITNIYDEDIPTLLFATPYKEIDPIPGGASASVDSLATPFLLGHSSILTINVSIPPATLNFNNTNITSDFLSHVLALKSDSKNINTSFNNERSESNHTFEYSSSFSNTTHNVTFLYEIFLTYMYEGNTNKEQYWEVLIDTSTSDGIQKCATKVAEFVPPKGSDPTEFAPPSYLFVSYSGVGSVLSVVVSAIDVSATAGVYVPDVSTRLTNGSLYSSYVSYGCDFIPGEAYRCTKLINPLTEVFCASLLFVGLTLTLCGHRWLNFTCFTSGFFAAWFLLFLIFVQIPNADIHALGIGTFIGSVAGGIGWLLVWHRFRRPLQSAVPIIMESAFLVAMIATHFIKYSVLPSTSNVAMLVVFPLLFTVALITYSIKNIKVVHIFSCVTLGSYATILPFAFYFGSTLNYIVINAVAAITVPGYTQAVGYPPFQKCDTALLTLWILIIALGFTVQLYRERNSPPFYPPNLQCWRATRNAGRFVYHSTFNSCCNFFGGFRTGATTAHASDTLDDDCGQRRGFGGPGEYQRAPTDGGISGVLDDGAPEGNGELIQQNGDSHGTLEAHRGGSNRLRDSIYTMSAWFSSLQGRQNNTHNYHSFPRYPGESEEDVDVDELESVRVEVPPVSIKEKVAGKLVAVRDLVMRTRSKMFGRQRLSEDLGTDDCSSNSSDQEVDRRAAGIFGDLENDAGEPVDSPAMESELPGAPIESYHSILQQSDCNNLSADESDEGSFEDAHSADLDESRLENHFTESQLVLK